MTTYNMILMKLKTYLPFALIAVFVITVQVPMQSAEAVERERLRQLEFDREYSDHFRNVAEALRASVVSVEARFTRQIRNTDGTFRTVYEEGNYGSGFVYDRQGHVFTDIRNVLQFPSSFVSPLNPRQQRARPGNYIKVTFFNGESYRADYVGVDAATGLAVIKVRNIDPEMLQPIVFSPVQDIQVGEPVMFLSYNYYHKNLLGGSFGVVAAIRGKYSSLDESENQFIMFNFPKLAGSDGGIVIDVYGRVIAMVSSYAPYRAARQLHYGIPVDTLSKVGNQIIDFGAYQRPWFGFTLLELNEMLKLQEDIDFDEGMYVAYVDPDSPAEDAGLQSGNILYKWDGEVVNDVAVILNAIERRQIGDVIEIEYYHRDFNVWDHIVTEYELTVRESDEEDELQRARERARRYL